MADNSFNALNGSGALLESCTTLRRAIMGRGVGSDEAMLLLSDLTVAFDLLQSAAVDLESIASEHESSWNLPKVKVVQALQDLNELKSGLRLAQSASFAASRALCAEMDHGTTQAVRSTEVASPAAAPAAGSPAQQRGKATTATK